MPRSPRTTGLVAAGEAERERLALAGELPLVLGLRVVGALVGVAVAVAVGVDVGADVGCAGGGALDAVAALGVLAALVGAAVPVAGLPLDGTDDWAARSPPLPQDVSTRHPTIRPPSCRRT